MMNHDYALDGTDQQEARGARRDPAYWAAVEDESYRWTPEMAVKKARQLGVSPKPFIDAMLERADLEARVDSGEYSDG